MNIRRILVALDASPDSLAALEAASEIAGRVQAELAGLFVEDINLLRLAGLPFAREIGYPSALSRRLNLAEMERALKGIAENARRALAEAAEKVRVPWTFQVARGSVSGELLAALAEADILALGIASRGTARRLGETALAVLAAAPRAVLLLRHGTGMKAPAMVWFDGSKASLEALSVAVELTRAYGDGDGIVVLTIAEDRNAASELKEQAAAVTKTGARFRLLAHHTISEIIYAARAENAGLFVFPSSCPLLGREDFQELVTQIGCPVFVAR